MMQSEFDVSVNAKNTKKVLTILYYLVLYMLCYIHASLASISALCMPSNSLQRLANNLNLIHVSYCSFSVKHKLGNTDHMLLSNTPICKIINALLLLTK